MKHTFHSHISIVIMHMAAMSIMSACYINTVLCYRRWMEGAQHYRLANNHMLMLGTNVRRFPATDQYFKYFPIMSACHLVSFVEIKLIVFWGISFQTFFNTQAGHNWSLVSNYWSLMIIDLSINDYQWFKRQLPLIPRFNLQFRLSSLFFWIFPCTPPHTYTYTHTLSLSLPLIHYWRPVFCMSCQSSFYCTVMKC